jgi:sec-independent protein translocase protein TatB
MFDVGFSELVVIALVALIVIGPERLPKVARTAGHLLGRLQRYVNEVKADVNREIQLEELKKLQAQLAEQAKAMESSVTQEIRETEATLNRSVAVPVAGLVAAVPDARAVVAPEPGAAPAPVATVEVVPQVEAALPAATLSAADSEIGDSAKQLSLGLDPPADKPKA